VLRIRHNFVAPKVRRLWQSKRSLRAFRSDAFGKANKVFEPLAKQTKFSSLWQSKQSLLYRRFVCFAHFKAQLCCADSWTPTAKQTKFASLWRPYKSSDSNDKIFLPDPFRLGNAPSKSFNDDTLTIESLSRFIGLGFKPDKILSKFVFRGPIISGR
jgi:hypothetical protein